MENNNEKQYILNPIGKIVRTDEGTFVQLNPELAQGLKGLEDYSHVNVYWWFDQADNERRRNVLQVGSPHEDAPSLLGVFATRSPSRPNPIAVTTARLLCVDLDQARIQISYTEAYNDSPVLDIKPYSPGLDRVEHPTAPKWGGCSMEDTENSREHRSGCSR